MADLISKQQVCEVLAQFAPENYTQLVEMLVVKLPTVDAVEVVRCKVCKWYEPVKDFGFDEATGKRDHSKIIEKPYGECHGQDFHFTEDGYLRVGEADFCSYGERREKNG